jgi:hypothetical protein
MTSATGESGIYNLDISNQFLQKWDRIRMSRLQQPSTSQSPFNANINRQLLMRGHCLDPIAPSKALKNMVQESPIQTSNALKSNGVNEKDDYLIHDRDSFQGS